MKSLCIISAFFFNAHPIKANVSLANVKEDKIVTIDFFKMKLGGIESDFPKTFLETHNVNFGLVTNIINKKRNNTQLPSEFVTEFICKNGLIFVKANLDGKEKKFLLDSGWEDKLVLNSQNKDITNLESSDRYVDGVGGEAKNLEMVRVKSFNWMGIRFMDIDSYALCLSHIDEDDYFGGMIGYSTFSNYQLTFDYKNNILKARLEEDLNKEVKENGRLRNVIPCKLKGHMPVFKIEINGNEYKMALDTGATTNLICAKHFKKLEKVTSCLKNSSIRGFNGEKVVKKGKILQTNINGMVYDNMTYSFDDLAIKNLNNNYGLGIDGIIGCQFLSKYTTVIDFPGNEIRIYDEQS